MVKACRAASREGRTWKWRVLSVAVGAQLACGAVLAQTAASEKPVVLGPVVVTASGFEQDLVRAPASITVIGKEEMKGKSYRDVTDVLQDVPGISIEGGGGGKLESTQIYIRGLGENYTLFMVDGKPLGSSGEAYYNGFGTATQVGWLPPLAAIERVEVIRGPMSSLYGSSALAGVINIITKDVTDRWSGTVSLDAVMQQDDDAGDSRQARYYLSGPLVADRLGLTLYGSIYDRDEDEIPNGYTDKRRVDNTAKLNWVASEKHRFELESGVAWHYNERTEKSGAPGEMDNERRHYSLTYDLSWGKDIETKTFVIHEDVEIENGTLRSEYSSTIANTKTVIPLKGHMLTIGGEYKEEETEHDASRFYGAADNLALERWQRALFIEDEWMVNDSLSITGGVRFDENEHYGSEVIPRLYGVYALTDRLVLKGGVSGGHKAPTLKQADPNIVENAARSRAFDMGNYNLKPETSTNYEVGLAWEQPGGLSAGITVYYTDFEDQIGKRIVCDTRPATLCEVHGNFRQYISQYVNHDTAELRGAEVSMSMPLGSLRLNASYTYSESEITESQDAPETVGNPFNDLPRHMVNLGADWTVNERLGLWSKARYRSESVEDSASRTPGYTLVDLGVNYRLSDHIDVYAGLYNLFDKEVSAVDYGKVLDGRRLNIGMSYNF